MNASSRPIARLWLALALGSAGQALAAQEQPDPRPAPVEIRIVELRSQEPMPGVPIYAVRRDSVWTSETDGFLRVLDERAELLRSARPVYSDPEGVARPVVSGGELAGYSVFAGPPFEGRLASYRDGYRIVVQRLEQYTVEVEDHEGNALARFLVALHAGGRDVAYAWTGRTGLAVFALPPQFAARAVVAPAGWLGSRDGMPTVARDLRRQRAKLVVPPHGYVRLRSVDGEAEAPVRFASLYLTDPGPAAPSRSMARKDRLGIEIGPVAVGVAVRGNVRAGRVGTSFRVEGPTRPGEVVTHDLDFAAVERAQAARMAERRQQAAARRPAVAAARVRPVSMVVRCADAPAVDAARFEVVALGEGGRLLGRFPLRPETSGGHPAATSADATRPLTGKVPVPRGEKVTLVVNLAGVEVARVPDVAIPAEGDVDDPRCRSIEVAERIEVRRVRVVDTSRVPVLAARFEVRDDPQRVGAAYTDAKGFATVCTVKGREPHIELHADGMRSRTIGPFADGAVFVMQPKATLKVTVVGVPKDAARDRLRVMLRTVDRERPRWSEMAKLGDGDTAELELPMAGSYLVRLVRAEQRVTGSSASTLVQAAQPLVVDEQATAGAFRLELSDEDAARVRTAVAKDAEGGR